MHLRFRSMQRRDDLLYLEYIMTGREKAPADSNTYFEV